MNDTKYFELLGRLSELEKRVEVLESSKVNSASMLVDAPEVYVATKKR